MNDEEINKILKATRENFYKKNQQLPYMDDTGTTEEKMTEVLKKSIEKDFEILYLFTKELSNYIKKTQK